jgi:hypothetical protein
MISHRQFGSNTCFKKWRLRSGQAASKKDYGSVSMWRDFSRAFRDLWRIPGDSGGSYRPDLHYMRGPGPKWHAKYGSLNAKTSSSAAPSRPALHNIAERRA